MLCVLSFKRRFLVVVGLNNESEMCVDPKDNNFGIEESTPTFDAFPAAN